MPYPFGQPASVSAVSINITSTNQSSTGSLRVIPSGAGNPPTAIMNYSPIQNIANAAVVGTNTGSTGGIFVYSASAAADVIIDVMGYFAPPVATPLDIVQAASAINNCATGGNCSMTASCPAGYVATGGGPQVSSFSSGVFWVYSAFSSNTTWLCQAVNTNASSLNLSCHATCARVPGI